MHSRRSGGRGRLANGNVRCSRCLRCSSASSKSVLNACQREPIAATVATIVGTPTWASSVRPAYAVQERAKFHVLLTSYEMLALEAGPLSRGLQYGVLVVDEVRQCRLRGGVCRASRGAPMRLRNIVLHADNLVTEASTGEPYRTAAPV